MLLAGYTFTHLYDLNLQLLRLIASSLVTVCRCEVAHANQGIRMFLAEHRLSRLHDLHKQLFGLLPSPWFLYVEAR